ncbi:MTP [Artemisia annua]|uniref:MTP n=1 Tax=Artemisia annua TaxID=35608 RepID=A0A2U1L0K3_ARTAN|nr:MTP [Artemisia annua]
MEDQRPEHVDISLDVSAEENRFAATKVCKGAPCGFSDARTSSNEAKERFASMWKLWAGISVGLKPTVLRFLTDAAHLLSDVAAFGIPDVAPLDDVV